MPNGEPSPLEEKLNTISSRLMELEDLQLVNKLDIINLKNELEKVKLTSSVPSPETLERIKELEKVVENAEEFSKLMGLVKNIDKVIARAREASPEGLEDMIRVVDDIDKRVRGLESKATGLEPKEAERYARMMEELKSSFEGLPKEARDIMGLSKRLERLRLVEEENARNIMRLSRAVRERPAPRLAAPLKREAAGPAALKCPRCGAALPFHARFCRMCGAKAVKD